MPTSYEECSEVVDFVKSVIQENNVDFQALRNHHVNFLGCIREKTTKEGELVSSGKPIEVKKIGPLHAVFIQCHFIIVVDKSRWDISSDTQKKAMIHHALMQHTVDATADGDLKFTKVQPDIQEFTTTVARYGAWSEPLIQFRDIFLRAGEQSAKKVGKELSEKKKE